MRSPHACALGKQTCLHQIRTRYIRLPDLLIEYGDAAFVPWKQFLSGSTQKMDTGINVQDRLIALHHLDIPWRPAEEERAGRYIKT